MAEQDSGANGKAPDDYPVPDPALSAQYRQAAVEQPPAHLDKAILKAARASVRAKKPLAFSPFASDWHVPIALAAVLVLSVVLVLEVRREPPSPALEEQIHTVPASARIEPGTPAGKAGVPAHARGAIKETPGLATPAPAAAQAVPGGNKIVAAKSIPGTASPVRPPGREQAAVPEFERLFMPDTGSETTSRVQAEADTAVPFSAVPVPQSQQKPSRMPLNSVERSPVESRLRRTETEAKTLVMETPVTRRTVPGDAERQARVRQFIATLAGAWSGRAMTTPVGPLGYDMNFLPAMGDCIKGTAHPGADHTWTFCARDGVLSLDFLSDFQGNRTPIRFRQLAYADGVYTFKADTHDFMEVLVHTGKSTAWMKIFHYGKLHVEIQLTRK